MRHPLQQTFLALTCAMLLLMQTAQAGESKPSHGAQDGHHASQSKHKGHHFAPHWAETLSDAQKADVDRLHLELERKLVVLKAREALKEKELNALTASDDAKQKAIYAKIDELMEVKRDIMRQRHDHIVEMRELLTPEQRVSYDMGVLGRSGVK